MIDQETERELNLNTPEDGEFEVDLSIDSDTELAILRQIDKQYRTDYYQLRTHARMNELVENSRLAEQQREEMKKLAIRIAALQKEIKDRE